MAIRIAVRPGVATSGSGKPLDRARPVACAQMVGGSRDMWTKAQRAAGFQSALERGEYSRIYDGQELREWRNREEYRHFREKIAPTLAID